LRTCSTLRNLRRTLSRCLSGAPTEFFPSVSSSFKSLSRCLTLTQPHSCRNSGHAPGPDRRRLSQGFAFRQILGRLSGPLATSRESISQRLAERFGPRWPALKSLAALGARGSSAASGLYSPHHRGYLNRSEVNDDPSPRDLGLGPDAFARGAKRPRSTGKPLRATLRGQALRLGRRRGHGPMGLARFRAKSPSWP
jgi:hypothetical protein